MSVVAGDSTHHLIDGRPLYTARFVEVLKFHAPGLAPVLDESGAYHIGSDGLPAYSARYRRTFGFYEGQAAVVTDAGWTHIGPSGMPSSASHWSWAGNFQEGRCPVRDERGRYGHLGPGGRPTCGLRYRYAGDYRDGVAVVQRDDGRSTHIDLAGVEVHGRWFEDLDVFHKGFARARDEAGWMHIDRLGQPVYGRRFTAVEPFYNGQARVERHDGGFDVIDETGEVLAELRPPQRSALHAQAVADPTWRAKDPFADAAADPGRVRELHAALASYAAHDYADVGSVIEPGRELIDAGGGSGALSVALLRAFPAAHAVVLDRPEVASIGVIPSDLADRMHFEGGDLFGPWTVRGDTVVLARVLHDWPDDRAVAILRRAREAVDADGRLYVVEHVRPNAGFRGGLHSLHLLLSTGGRERTAEEFRTLLHEAGWAYAEVRPLGTVVDVIVARAA